MGWGPGPGEGEGGQKKQKHPHLYRSPEQTPNLKRKTFFFLFQAEDLLNPWMIWIAL